MQCIGRRKKEKWERCRNKAAKYSLVCKFHRYQIIIFLLITIPSVIGIYGGVFRDVVEPLMDSGELPDIICDRDKTDGCFIDIPLELFALTNRPVTGRVKGAVVTFMMEFGNLNLNVADVHPDYEHSYTAFPIYLNSGPSQYFINKQGPEGRISTDFDDKYGEQVNGPYNFWLTPTGVFFEGQIKDFKTDELLGWFNENEFGVVETCSFSWNKDSAGIEIIDKYGYVCFSINTIKINAGLSIKPYGIDFRGYFKEGEHYYIFNDSTSYKTSSIIEAKRLIKDIKPLFEHFASDSQGIRLM